MPAYETIHSGLTMNKNSSEKWIFTKPDPLQIQLSENMLYTVEQPWYTSRENLKIWIKTKKRFNELSHEHLDKDYVKLNKVINLKTLNPSRIKITKLRPAFTKSNLVTKEQIKEKLDSLRKQCGTFTERQTPFSIKPMFQANRKRAVRSSKSQNSNPSQTERMVKLMKANQFHQAFGKTSNFDFNKFTKACVSVEKQQERRQAMKQVVKRHQVMRLAKIG